MGAFSAYGMVDHGNETGIPLEIQIRWHLTSNHYPPVPVLMIPICVEAVTKANEAIANFDEEAWDEKITLPEGVSWRGEKEVPLHVLIEEFHLDAWLVQDEEY